MPETLPHYDIGTRGLHLFSDTLRELDGEEAISCQLRYRDVLRLLRDDGWYLERTAGTRDHAAGFGETGVRAP